MENVNLQEDVRVIIPCKIMGGVVRNIRRFLGLFNDLDILLAGFPLHVIV